VIMALRYKSEGESMRALILLAALGPGVHSVSKKNDYQTQKNNVSGKQSAAGA
jgi:hypothetical protein